MADSMPTAPDAQPPTLTDLHRVIYANLPNPCCADDPHCPYDHYDANRLSEAILDWLEGLLARDTTRIGRASADPGSITPRSKDYREVLAQWSARAIRAEIMRAAREVGS